MTQELNGDSSIWTQVSLSLSLKPHVPSIYLLPTRCQALSSNSKISTTRKGLLNDQTNTHSVFSSVCPSSKTFIYLVPERLIIAQLVSPSLWENTDRLRITWEQIQPIHKLVQRNYSEGRRTWMKSTCTVSLKWKSLRWPLKEDLFGLTCQILTRKRARETHVKGQE